MRLVALQMVNEQPVYGSSARECKRRWILGLDANFRLNIGNSEKQVTLAMEPSVLAGRTLKE